MHHRSLEAEVLRTSECGNAASKRPPSRSLLAPLTTDEPWLAAVEAFRARHPRRHEQLTAYESLLADGRHRDVGAAVLAGTYRPDPPIEGRLNKADGRKKRIFQYRPHDELLFRVVNRLLQPTASRVASPACRSFLPGGGARAVFATVARSGDVMAHAALRLDVRDYFNSIDVDDLLGRLPDEMRDPPTFALLDHALRDDRVERHGEIVGPATKGVMAGTPLAPMLATLYLRDLDDEVRGTGATYVRYSDDVLVLAPSNHIASLERLLRTRLAERGLAINESKTATFAPGEPWDFLGLRHDHGRVTLAPLTERKFRDRTTRLARRLLRWREQRGVSSDVALRTFVARMNARLYGTHHGTGEFSWATWFLPVIDEDAPLRLLDRHMQREARYVATGRRTARTHRSVPHDRLVAAGHLPLVPAYWAMRDGAAAYDALVNRRTSSRPD